MTARKADLLAGGAPKPDALVPARLGSPLTRSFATLLGLPAAFRDGVFPSLRHTQYSRLWLANVGSTFAFGMQGVAQGWLAIELTNSPFVLGLLGFFMSIPMLILSPFGGVLADRFDRTKLLISAQTVMLFSTLAIAVLVATGAIHIAHLAAAAFIMGATFGVNMPSRNALMSELVPRRDLSNAVGLNASTLNASRIVGPSLAGALIGLVGIAATYFTQVAGYVWSTVNLLRIRAPVRESRARGPVFAVLRDGFSYVVRTKAIMALMILAMAPAVFSMPATFLLPAFVKQDLRAGPEYLGILTSMLGVGALCGSLTVVVFSRFRYKGRAAMAGAFAYGLLVFTLGMTSSVVMASLALAAAGFFSAVYMATNQTILQLVVPNELRGRVLSIWMLSWGMQPLGLLPLSAIAEVRGVPTAMMIGGGLSTAFVVGVFIWRRELWRMTPDDATVDDDEAAVAPSDSGG